MEYFPANFVSCSFCGWSACYLIGAQCAMFSMCASAGVVGGMFLCSRLEVPFLNQAQESSSSLPPLKPFQKQLYYSTQAHGTEENQEDVPIVIQGIDPVSTLCIKTCHTGFLRCELAIGALYDNMSNVALALCS